MSLQKQKINYKPQMKNIGLSSQYNDTYTNPMMISDEQTMNSLVLRYVYENTSIIVTISNPKYLNIPKGVGNARLFMRLSHNHDEMDVGIAKKSHNCSMYLNIPDSYNSPTEQFCRDVCSKAREFSRIIEADSYVKILEEKEFEEMKRQTSKKCFWSCFFH